MTTERPETVDQLILQRLSEATLSETAKDLIFAAMLGHDELADTLGGAVPPRPLAPVGEGEDPEPIGTYLAGIEVTGFRGIGPTALLSLVPGPGLTIVTGRNGSGKSSFAEAAEFALTGSNKRWAGRTAVWQDGWRNLHVNGDARIRVRLGVDGHRRGGHVECHWNGAAALADHDSFFQIAGQPRQPVADLGWDAPLELYRPFLSYAELGGLLTGKPSEMHDSLQRILGLGRLVEIEQMLKAARKDADDRRKAAATSLPELRTRLGAHPDPRARRAEQALSAKVADLDQLAGLTVGHDDADAANVGSLRQLDVLELPHRDDIAGDVARLRGALREIDELAGTPTEQARALAGLLRTALTHHRSHPDQACPVCGGRTLDRAWAERTEAEVRRLTGQAERLDAAYRNRQAALRSLRDRVPALPAVLSADLGAEGVQTGDARAAWMAWDNLVAHNEPTTVAASALGTFDELAAALQPVQVAARHALERRQQAWQPVADHIRDWITLERDGRHAARMYAELKKAITWLTANGNEIRNDRLRPVADEATRIWNTLRQQSNIGLGPIRLVGTGPTRRVALDVAVDGVPGAALGVMSQGELHSLALALFLPRATMDASPFRFLIIDDPVQSMDPAKVYGLAQVLARVAEHRQVIVFTHDDRLPAAVRHLQMKARILTVSRLARSHVSVTGDRHGDPALRYLEDAWAIANDEDMAPGARTRVVCNLIRDAIEFTCQETVRIRDFRAGTPLTDTEEAIGAAHGLRPNLALALIGDATKVGELPAQLRKLDPSAPHVVAAANSGSHDGNVAALNDLVADARRIVRRLIQP